MNGYWFVIQVKGFFQKIRFELAAKAGLATENMTARDNRREMNFFIVHLHCVSQSLKDIMQGVRTFLCLKCISFSKINQLKICKFYK